MAELPEHTGADLLVLHTLRCIGFADLARISAAVGIPESQVESEVLDLAVSGLVTRIPGVFGGWGLTEAGRIEDADRTAVELAAAGTRKALTEGYERFLVLNPELLDLCTAWQTRSDDGTWRLNNHADPAYDARVLYQFADFHSRAGAVLADLATTLPRFQRYGARLAGALARARAGSLEYVTDSTASYHAIWYQLHEDLLSTLGIPR
jgi:hypothetical protein